jgi:hypothetical protein
VLRVRTAQPADLAVDEVGGRAAVRERRMTQAVPKKCLIRARTERDEVRHRHDQAAPRTFPGAADCDDLGDHRVIVRRNFRSRYQRVLDPHAGRRYPQMHAPALRREAFLRILTAEANLDRVAGERHVLDRAVALAEMNHIAVAVGEYLHLDVTRRADGNERCDPRFVTHVYEAAVPNRQRLLRAVVRIHRVNVAMSVHGVGRGRLRAAAEAGTDDNAGEDTDPTYTLRPDGKIRQ